MEFFLKTGNIIRYSKAMEKFTWARIVQGNDCFHLVRTLMRGRSPCVLHAQDYPEVFWIEEGEGVHLINGHRVKLQPGALVWVRTKDCHSFSVSSPSGMVLVNLAFPVAVAEYLRGRYFSDESRFFWNRGRLPETSCLDSASLRRLGDWTAVLDRRPRTQFALDWFLLNLLHGVRYGDDTGAEVDLPDWLGLALRRLREPEQFRNGVRGLALLAGRTPEHVNAVLKARLGLTATAVVNRARMEYAASRLRMDTDKIIAIGLDCGFESPGHFYAVFREHYQTTPRAYRQQHRRRSVLGG